MPRKPSFQDLQIQLTTIIRVHRSHSPPVPVGVHLPVPDGLAETLTRCELLGSLPEGLLPFGAVYPVQPDLDLPVTISECRDGIPVGYADDTGCYQVIGYGCCGKDQGDQEKWDKDGKPGT